MNHACIMDYFNGTVYLSWKPLQSIYWRSCSLMLHAHMVANVIKYIPCKIIFLILLHEVIYSTFFSIYTEQKKYFGTYIPVTLAQISGKFWGFLAILNTLKAYLIDQVVYGINFGHSLFWSN